MNETSASRTALVTSLMRAVHTRFDRPALIDDPWGDRLVLDSERKAIQEVVTGALEPEARKQLDALGSPEAVLHAALRASPAYGTVIVRTRYAEDALEGAVVRGARQYVIIGAGMDSFALRQPAFAQGVEVFEIDHPATQGLKRRRLRECAVSLPQALHFVAADLSQEQLGAALARSSFRRAQPTFFSWLGVTAYLTRDANLATLRAIAACAAHESTLVFTYLDQREFDPDRQSDDIQRTRARVASLGEPWLSGFDPAELADDLRDVGLALVEDLGGEELRARYCRDRNDGLSPADTLHIARAQVAA
jgi:methyltransferase (TIGR00027 family)